MLGELFSVGVSSSLLLKKAGEKNGSYYYSVVGFLRYRLCP